MATPDDLRSLALALPESAESSHFGQPDFRVRGKIFASLEPKEGMLATLKFAPELQAMLLAGKPEAFTAAAGYWGRMGWTRVQLKRLKRAELVSLVEESWRLVAPKKLLAAFKPELAVGAGASRSRTRDRT